MSQSVINLRREQQVAVVELNRPERHNAVDMAMFDALRETGEALADDPAVRAVVLCGSGEHFCAGIDTSLFADGSVDPASLAALPGSAANLFQAAACVWRELPVPVIAALQGVAYGAGFQIAMGADVRLASPTTKLSVMEIKWGLMPDMALSVNLPPLLSYDRAAELMWSGRIVDAPEARATGLVTAVVDDPVSQALALAGDIARRSPDAIRAGKSLLKSAYGRVPADLLRQEAELQLRILGGRNFREAIAANLEKREPTFDNSEI